MCETLGSIPRTKNKKEKKGGREEEGRREIVREEGREGEQK
jgi:hypothetical protein